MEAEDVSSPPANVASGSTDEKNELYEVDTGPSGAECLDGDFKAKEVSREGDDFIGLNKDDVGSEEGEIVNEEGLNVENGVEGLESNGLNLNDDGTGGVSEILKVNGEIETDAGNFAEVAEVDMDLVDSPMQVRIEVVDAVAIVENVSSGDNIGSGFLHAEKESIRSNNTRDGRCVSGVKRARSTYEKEQPSVHVTYNSLTRASKRKLEELLKQWSEWHAQHDFSSQVEEEVLESGEDTYFPALFVGTSKSSSVSFWIENKTRKQQTDDCISFNANSVPLYDRGFTLGLTSSDGPSNIERGLEVVGEVSRCFNCGSYNHSLKECPKPRDNVAVNNARKHHKAKRNQNANPRNSTRYYQTSTGGKYDGLKPGTLDAETRQVLGLGELDPPPWLHRMRQLGYPPGYLAIDDENQPSGITIFADDEDKGQEDGEIIGEHDAKAQKKMTVEFPGINAPIPENADPWLWAVTPSIMDTSTIRAHHRPNHLEPTSRWSQRHHEQRGTRDPNCEGPPGVDSECSPSFSSYPPRRGMYDYFNNSDGIADAHFRSYSSDRGKRSILAYEDFINDSPYKSPHSSNGRRSPHVRYEHYNDRWSRHSHSHDFRHSHHGR